MPSTPPWHLPDEPNCKHRQGPHCLLQIVDLEPPKTRAVQSGLYTKTCFNVGEDLPSQRHRTESGFVVGQSVPLVDEHRLGNSPMKFGPSPERYSSVTG